VVWRLSCKREDCQRFDWVVQRTEKENPVLKINPSRRGRSAAGPAKTWWKRHVWRVEMARCPREKSGQWRGSWLCETRRKFIFMKSSELKEGGKQAARCHSLFGRRKTSAGGGKEENPAEQGPGAWQKKKSWNMVMSKRVEPGFVSSISSQREVAKGDRTERSS